MLADGLSHPAPAQSLRMSAAGSATPTDEVAHPAPVGSRSSPAGPQAPSPSLPEDLGSELGDAQAPAVVQGTPAGGTSIHDQASGAAFHAVTPVAQPGTGSLMQADGLFHSAPAQTMSPPAGPQLQMPFPSLPEDLGADLGDAQAPPLVLAPPRDAAPQPTDGGPPTRDAFRLPTSAGLAAFADLGFVCSHAPATGPAAPPAALAADAREDDAGAATPAAITGPLAAPATCELPSSATLAEQADLGFVRCKTHAWADPLPRQERHDAQVQQGHGAITTSRVVKAPWAQQAPIGSQQRMRRVHTPHAASSWRIDAQRTLPPQTATVPAAADGVDIYIDGAGTGSSGPPSGSHPLAFVYTPAAQGNAHAFMEAWADASEEATPAPPAAG